MNNFLRRLKRFGVLCLIGMSYSTYAQNGMKFDGVDDYISVPEASSLIAGSSNIAMSFWVYPENYFTGWPDFDGFAGFRNNLDADFYVMQLAGTEIEARFRNSAGTNFDVVYYGLEMEVWNHFILTYDGATLTLYHNGVDVGSVAASGTIESPTAPFEIGRTYYLSLEESFYLDGKVDHIGVWNNSISPSEAVDLYVNTCQYDFSNPDLVLAYEFNEGIAEGDNTALTELQDGKDNIDGEYMNIALTGVTSNFTDGIAGARVASITESDCDSYTTPSGGATYTETGIYVDTLVSEEGCDSLLTIHLTIGGSMTTISETACYTYTVPSGDETYTESGIYLDTLVSEGGCDSVLTINLTIAGETEGTTSVTACESYTVPSGDATYTESGVYTDILVSEAGCDSILTINLTITGPAEATITETACESYTVPSGDATYTESGVYTDILVSEAGCDSILTINLTINTVNVDVAVDEDTLTAELGGATYQWIDCTTNSEVTGANDQSFTPTSNGDYAVIVTMDGCSDTSSCYSITLTGSGIDENSLENVSTYPNPITDQLTVNLARPYELITIKITTLAGEEVLSQVFQNTAQLELSLENQAAGMYVVTINADQLSRTLKVVKQ